MSTTHSTPDPPPAAGAAPQPAARARRKLPLWKKLLFSTIIVVAPFALLEGCLRLLMPQQIWTDPEGRVVATEDVPWAMIPNKQWRMGGPGIGLVHVATNADGIVDNEHYTVEKPAGVLRVLFLGDSFAEGWALNYEHRFAVVVERALQSRLGKQRVEVIKAGIRGFDSFDELNAFERKWAAYKPDVVLVGFLLNDLIMNPPFDPAMSADQRNDLVKQRRRRIGGGSFERLSLQFHTLGLIKRMLMESDALYTRLYFTWRDGHQYFRTPLSAASEQRYADTVGWLGLLNQRCRDVGAELHVFFLPQRIQVLVTQKPVEGIDPYLLPRHLGELLRAAGVASHDLLPAMSIYDPELTHFTGDGHFNPSGASIAAREMLTWLLTESPAVRRAIAARDARAPSSTASAP